MRSVLVIATAPVVHDNAYLVTADDSGVVPVA
jgi:hypothetical protein